MKLVSGVLVVCALGCGSKRTDDGPAPATVLPACAPAVAHACNTYTCGGNSAITNAFPINGLRPDGECSPEGIQLVPGSMDAACQGATLDILDGKLVGRTGTAITCAGQALKGASFAVASAARTERIVIAEVDEAWTAPNGEQRTAYRMVWAKEMEVSPDGALKGLCGKQGQKLRKALGVPEMLDTQDLLDAKEDVVIPVVSELYTEEGFATAVDPTWQVQKAEWNQLACVDDALAKRAIYHLDHPEAGKRRAALRMLTADYCGATAWTVRGEWISWAHQNGLDVEAQWDANGATCLTAPRLLRDDNNQVVEPPVKSQHLLDRLCEGKCKTVDDWMSAMRTCRDPTGAVVRTLGTCPACEGDGCPLASRNAKAP